MASRMKQISVYTRLTIVIILFVALVVVVFKNRNYTTNFWPGASSEPVATLWLMLATAILSIIVFWLLSKTRRVFKDLSQLRAEEALESKAAETERLRRNLADQERRIDEKLQRAIGPEQPHP
ncbi:MAG TPA: hypothetical protein VMV81_00025 [Phycisphaerae bacterium]|nr:hypothetical protein [Phycisphaerae bacterium]